MLDLVLAGNLPKLAGIEGLALASSLPNFRQPRDAAAAKNEGRAKGALLHSPQYEFDEGTFKELARGGGAVVFSFSDLLRERGFRRAIMLSKMRLAFEACRKAGCGAIVCTLAASEGELRNARELVSFMAALGMTQEEREFSESLLEKLAGAQAGKGGAAAAVPAGGKRGTA